MVVPSVSGLDGAEYREERGRVVGSAGAWRTQLRAVSATAARSCPMRRRPLPGSCTWVLTASFCGGSSTRACSSAGGVELLRHLRDHLVRVPAGLGAGSGR
ncbi:hypothetical protein C3V41_07870 [Actinomyces sp. oral taxon 897]|nr:hypothetical protein C3V41_07870 [Actinomyces sp. oral taxon 897]